MSKIRRKKTSRKVSKLKIKKNTKREARKRYGHQGRYTQKKYNFSRNTRKKYSNFIKRKESSNPFSLYSSENIKSKVLLPQELLVKAKKILGIKPSVSKLIEAMTIYDVNDTINYNYLKNSGKISPENYKYIYTLSLNNRKKIISQYKINKEIFTKSSKIIFHELVNFLITKYIPNNESCKNKLKKYNLEHFNKFIIPINEGTSELKYFNFINVILDWFDKDPENGKSYLTEFKDFFKKKKNLHKINNIYYIILISF